MKTLHFKQVTDNRFDDNIKELLEARVGKLKELLNIDGVNVVVEPIYEIPFEDGSKQCRCDFFVRKTNKKTWDDIYRIVNSVKPAVYELK